MECVCLGASIKSFSSFGADEKSASIEEHEKAHDWVCGKGDVGSELT